MNDVIQQGVNAYKSGDHKTARILFISAIKQTPNSERAWGWLFNVCKTDQERLYCLNQVIRINPENAKAKELLVKLTAPQELSYEHPVKQIVQIPAATSPQIQHPHVIDDESQQKPTLLTKQNLSFKNAAEPTSLDTRRKSTSPQKNNTIKKYRSLFLIFGFALSIICIMAVGILFNFAIKQASVLPVNTVAPATATILTPTSAPIDETIPSVLKTNGFRVSNSYDDQTLYESSCGSIALWDKSNPNSINFAIPLDSSVCNTMDIMEPVLYSIYTLYPKFVGNWFMDTEKLELVSISGKAFTEEVSSYFLTLYFDKDSSVYYFVIIAPGDLK